MTFAPGFDFCTEIGQAPHDTSGSIALWSAGDRRQLTSAVCCNRSRPRRTGFRLENS